MFLIFFLLIWQLFSSPHKNSQRLTHTQNSPPLQNPIRNSNTHRERLREGDAKERRESQVWKEGTEGLIKQQTWWKVLQIPQFEEEIIGDDERGCV